VSIDACNNIRSRYVSVPESLIRSDIQLKVVYSGLKVIALCLKGRIVKDA